MTRNMKVLLIVVINLCLCAIVSCFMITEEPPVKYEGPYPQTPESILEAFVDKGLINNPNPEQQQKLNEKYPTEWLEMLLDKGIVIEDADDFSGYMSIRNSLRNSLNFWKSKPERWRLYGVQYNDRETYEDAFIDRRIWEYQQLKAAKRKNRNVGRVDFLGADGKTVIPITNSSKYITVNITKHKGMGVGGSITGGGGSKLSEQQKFDLFYKGKHPWGWKIIYVDEANNVLPERPEPISREDLGLPADVPWPPKNREHLDQIIEDVTRRENLKEDR